MVLDGQQRLQRCFNGLCESIQGKECFSTYSGDCGSDDRENKLSFWSDAGKFPWEIQGFNIHVQKKARKS